MTRVCHILNICLQYPKMTQRCYIPSTIAQSPSIKACRILAFSRKDSVLPQGFTLSQNHSNVSILFSLGEQQARLMFTAVTQVNTKVMGGGGGKNQTGHLKATLSKSQRVLFLGYLVNRRYHKYRENPAYACSSAKLLGAQNESSTSRWLRVVPSDQAKRHSTAWHQVTPEFKDLSESVLQPY